MEQLLTDWLSHPEYWFSPTHQYDSYITQTYQHLFSQSHPPSLATIILHDQVARHVYRDQHDKINQHLAIALAHRSQLPPPTDPLQWTFYNLPVRHEGNPRMIIQVLHAAWDKLKKNPTQETHLLNFLKATYKHLPDEPTFLELNTQHPVEFNTFNDYLDILDHCPLEFQGNHRKSLLYQVFDQYLKKHRFQRIIISLSGGVDSQVCSYLLKLLSDKYHYDLVALHINYNNRVLREAEFVQDWCCFLDIPCYTRHLHEIQRKPCMEYNLRDTYETYTRNVRFNAYKTLQGDVFLGHNEDDTFENILTNIAHKSKYDNLRGMAETQFLDQIPFHRPLLRIPKHSIYQYAKHVGIPYLKDSTPNWSQRGIIRDTVRPTLEKWEPTIVDAFFDLSDAIQEYDALATAYLTNLPIQELPNNAYQVQIPTPLITCRRLWSKLFERLHIHCSHKSMNNFMEIIVKEKNNKINIHKHVQVHQDTNTFTILPMASNDSSSE
jgi:tRNA(Ile)-lysidine synthetase-like protein